MRFFVFVFFGLWCKNLFVFLGPYSSPSPCVGKWEKALLGKAVCGVVCPRKVLPVRHAVPYPMLDGHNASISYGLKITFIINSGRSLNPSALPIPAPNLGQVIPLPAFQFWCGDDCFLKMLKWYGDRPRDGSKGVIPYFRKVALGGASWYLCF